MGNKFQKPKKLSDADRARVQELDLTEEKDTFNDHSSHAQLFLRHITKKQDLLSQVESFETVDQHAQNAPPEMATSFDILLNYLMASCNTSLNTVRVLYMWVLTHIELNETPVAKVDLVDLSNIDPLRVLRTRQGTSLEINLMFHYLCQLMCVPCVLLQGFVKCPKEDSQKLTSALTASVNHVWSLVLVQNQWRFVDSACGKGYPDMQEKNRVEAIEVFFLPDPEDYILTHFPLFMSNQMFGDSLDNVCAISIQAEPTLQMLQKPISFPEFCQKACPTIFAVYHGVELASHTAGLVPVKTSETFEFTAPTLVNMAATLVEISTGRVCHNSVLATRSADSCYKIFVKPKSTGEYILQVLGVGKGNRDNNFRLVVSYLLQVEEVEKPFVAFPEHLGVWGANLIALQFGFTKAIFRFDILTSRSGEIYIKLPTNCFVQTKSVLSFEREGAASEYTSSHLTLNQYIQGVVHVRARLTMSGFCNLSLLAYAPESDGCEGAAYTTMANFAIHCFNPTLCCAPYPRSYPVAQSYQVLLLEPMRGELTVWEPVVFRLRSTLLTKVKVEGESMVKTRSDSDDTWWLEFTPTRLGVPIYIYGTVGLDALMHALYKFNVIAANVFTVSTHM